MLKHRRQLTKLDQAKQRTKFRDTTTVTKVVVKPTVICPTLALVPIRAGQVIFFIAFCGDHSSFARSHDFGREERKGRSVGEFPGFDSFKLATVCMSGILDDKQPMSAAIVHHRWKFRGNNSSDVHPCNPGNIPMLRHLFLDHSQRWRKGLWIHIKIVDYPSSANDGGDGGKVCVRWNQNSTTADFLQAE